MKKIPLQLLLTSLLFASAPTAFAASCSFTGSSNIPLNGATLHVAPQAPIGSVIGEIVFRANPNPQNTKELSYLATCTGQTKIKTEMMPKWKPTGLFGTYQTDIKGVGMRVTNPYSFAGYVPSMDYSYPKGNLAIAIPEFKIQFIKIAEEVGAGKQHLGEVMQFQVENKKSRIVTAMGVTISAAACTVDTYDKLVQLDPVRISEFKGSTPVKYKNFTLNVSCQNTVKNPQIAFSLPNSSGWKAGEVPFSSTSTAKGAVFHVEKEGVPIPFDKKLPLNLDGSYKTSIPMRVAYKKTGLGQVEAGNASGLMTFELIYN